MVSPINFDGMPQTLAIHHQVNNQICTRCEVAIDWISPLRTLGHDGHLSELNRVWQQLMDQIVQLTHAHISRIPVHRTLQVSSALAALDAMIWQAHPAAHAVLVCMRGDLELVACMLPKVSLRPPRLQPCFTWPLDCDYATNLARLFVLELLTRACTTSACENELLMSC